MSEKTMTDAAREARNRYAREWRAKNKEKIRRYNEAYWTRKAEKGGDSDAEVASTE